MISKETIQFLKDLKQNNNREWFQDNKKRYATAKKDVESFVAAVLAELPRVDSDIAGLAPKDCMFRIYRDVRFSKSKEPYKTNFGASIAKGGRKSPFPGYYIHIEPGGSFWGGGLYMPSGPFLKAIRQEIDYNQKAFEKIVWDKEFKETYGDLWADDKLKTAPQGYGQDHPAIEWLRMKSFIAFKEVKDSEILKETVVEQVVSDFATLKPMIDFLKMPLYDELVDL